MILLQKIKILSKLGEIMREIGNNKPWAGFSLGINQSEYESLSDLVSRAHVFNGWFTPEAVKSAFIGISDWLTEDNLKKWVDNYPISEKNNREKKIAIIMAGNIPLVGFHDFIAVFLSGNKTLAKLSSDDQHLFPALIKTLHLFDPSIEEWVEIAQGKIENFDAVIATGSNNSATYFESYFGKYPHIIRKNRTSVAVLDNTETKEDLVALGKDIFAYFGLGCRNVSQIWIPKDYDLNLLFEAMFPYKEIINHNKYANNYDYNKAVYLMNQENLLDNGFILLKEDEKLNSPLGMLHYVHYQNESEVKMFLEKNKTDIQAIIGKKFIPFGKAQTPSLNDYADDVDTLNFLLTLK